MRMRTPSVAAAGVMAVVVATGIATPPVSARPAPVTATKPGPHWTRLSSGSLSNTTSIALGRFGTDLQVVWTQSVGARKGLYTRILSGAGTPRTGVIAVLPSAWRTINSFPAIIPYAGGRMLTFSGQRTTRTTDRYAAGYEYYLTSRDGKAWTLANGTLSAGDLAYGSYGTDATVAAGQPVVAYTAGSASRISYHQGIITPIPHMPATDPTTSDTGNFAYNTGLGTDTGSARTWAVWFSNSGARTTDGVQAQRILPSLGALVHGPQSAEKSGGGWASVAVNERIVVAERTDAGGGLYAGYAVGYPSAKRVALWRLGSGALIIPGGAGVHLVGTAAGPGGRMWLYWWDANAGVIDAVRTNPGATRFGAVTSIPTPLRSTQLWDIDGNAAGGPLQLVVNSGSSRPQVFSTVVEPDLTVKASPASIAVARGGRVTVTVTDAGQAVRGATARFAGGRKVTGPAGEVTFSVAKGTKKGRYTVVVTDSGYATTKATVTLH
jgi:hypothetical protein